MTETRTLWGCLACHVPSFREFGHLFFGPPCVETAVSLSHPQQGLLLSALGIAPVTWLRPRPFLRGLPPSGLRHALPPLQPGFSAAHISNQWNHDLWRLELSLRGSGSLLCPGSRHDVLLWSEARAQVRKTRFYRDPAVLLSKIFNLSWVTTWPTSHKDGWGLNEIRRVA